MNFIENIRQKISLFLPYLLQGKEIYLVGGAVRDAILGYELLDFDFAVKCNAIEFAKEFAKKTNGVFVLLDEKNCEARVVVNKFNFDFTSFNEIKEDLMRRDFKMNAIAIKLPEMKLFDPYNGINEIEKKRISMIKAENFVADPLRILRAFRFAAIHNFKITKATMKYIKKYKDLIKNVAKERIKNELDLILKTEQSYSILNKMARIGLLQIIIEELKSMENTPQFKSYANLLSHSLLTIKRIELLIKNNELGIGVDKALYVPLKLAGLLHDIGKPHTFSIENNVVHFYGHEKKGVELLENIKEELRLSNFEYKIIKTLILYHMRPHLLARERNPTRRSIWRIVRDAGDFSPYLFLLSYADALASGGRRSKSLYNVCKIGIGIYNETKKEKFERVINGYDLINLGLKPSPLFKELLQRVEEKQVAGEIKTKEEAIELVKQILQNNNLS